MVLAPVAGVLVTVLGLTASFHEVAEPGADPSTKAQSLSDGISMSMYATVFGLVGAAIGGVMLLVCGVWYSRLPKQ